MPSPAIEIENLTKEYPFGFLHLKKRTSLEGLSMQVEMGDVFGFIGPNGAGKSTTIKLLMGLIFPTAGSARILGKPISDVEMHRDIGYLPEQPYFYDYLTAAEVLDYFARFHDLTAADRKDRVEQMLKKVGLETARKIQLRKYSKGMLQRVGLAQAILHEPKVVSLDEPMSGLDPVGRREVRDIVLELKKDGKTVMFSTHILSDAEMLCDRVGVIVGGKLRGVGAPGRLVDMKTQGMEILFELAGTSAAPLLSRATRTGEYYRLQVAEEEIYGAMDQLRAAGAKVLSVSPRCGAGFQGNGQAHTVRVVGKAGAEVGIPAGEIRWSGIDAGGEHRGDGAGTAAGHDLREAFAGAKRCGGAGGSVFHSAEAGPSRRVGAAVFLLYDVTAGDPFHGRLIRCRSIRARAAKSADAGDEFGDGCIQ